MSIKQMEALVQKWRDCAELLKKNGGDRGKDEAEGMLVCAYELTALAASLQGGGDAAPKRLIGWRSGDYLRETSDRSVALSWLGNVEVLPIFEGDKNTKLPTPVPADLERDAARYRWLRRGLADSKLMPDDVAKAFADALDSNDATKFDAAIDDAMGDSNRG